MGQVAVTSVDVDVTDAAAGASWPVRVKVDLGGLSPDDVVVEVVHGPLGHDGEFRRDLATVELQPPATASTPARSSVGVAGSYGVTARIIPAHPDLANRFDVGRVAWA